MSTTEPIQPANAGLRFLNHIIDTVCVILLPMCYALLFDGKATALVPKSAEPFFFLSMFCIWFFFVRGGMEILTGKSPGKYLTKTKVVNENGGKISFLQGLLRTICRLVPFNWLFVAASGRGIHDLASNTYVVYDKPSEV